jgi:small-conductance mechanosensitive channel
MDKTIIKITKISAFILGAVSLVFWILLIINRSNLQAPTPEAVSSPLLGNYLVIAYVSLAIAVVVAVIFPVIHMASNPKQAVKGFLGFAAIVVLGLISYLLSSNEFTALQLERLKVSESISVLVGTGLILTYIVGVVTILAAVFLAIKGSLSK